jgi:hypothetical protein
VQKGGRAAEAPTKPGTGRLGDLWQKFITCDARFVPKSHKWYGRFAIASLYDEPWRALTLTRHVWPSSATFERAERSVAVARSIAACA